MLPNSMMATAMFTADEPPSPISLSGFLCSTGGGRSGRNPPHPPPQGCGGLAGPAHFPPPSPSPRGGSSTSKRSPVLLFLLLHLFFLLLLILLLLPLRLLFVLPVLLIRLEGTGVFGFQSSTLPSIKKIVACTSCPPRQAQKKCDVFAVAPEPGEPRRSLKINLPPIKYPPLMKYPDRRGADQRHRRKVGDLMATPCPKPAPPLRPSVPNETVGGKQTCGPHPCLGLSGLLTLVGQTRGGAVCGLPWFGTEKQVRRTQVGNTGLEILTDVRNTGSNYGKLVGRQTLGAQSALRAIF